jgi:hypothetical protein
MQFKIYKLFISGIFPINIFRLQLAAANWNLGKENPQKEEEITAWPVFFCFGNKVLLNKLPKLALNSWFSCLSLSSTVKVLRLEAAS